MTVDLNADVGESFGIYRIGDDEALMRCISSANVAAGFHGGDPSVLRHTLRLAASCGVAVGAHPSFPDLAGFGRREIRMPDREVEDAVLYQIASVAGVAKVEGLRLAHVKPHGALYNMAARESGLAEAVVRAMTAFDPGLRLYAPPGSALALAAAAAGVRLVPEGFADRAYDSNGRLVSRAVGESVIDDPERAAAQAVQLATLAQVTSVDGVIVPLRVDTICVHGDALGAARRAARIRAALEASGVSVRRPS